MTACDHCGSEDVVETSRFDANGITKVTFVCNTCGNHFTKEKTTSWIREEYHIRSQQPLKKDEEESQTKDGGVARREYELRRDSK